MCAAATTLYRDWNKRRDYLRALPRRGVLVKRQLRILDYMLREYGGSHDAHQAARFEFSAALYGSYVTVSSALYLNYRAILIHHHIRAQQCTRENKVERIIGRMTQRHAPKKIRRERGVGGAFMKVWTSVSNNAAILAGALIPFANMEFVTGILPTLSDDTVGTLCEWAQRPALYALAATGILLCCHNLSMTDYLVLAWRNRLMNIAPDMCLSLIEDLLCQPERAAKTAERLRHELASPSKAVRLRTLKLLERVGSLDDVTLLMDMASLPKMRDEARGERKAILETAACLALGS